jgi:hypothetical protein
MVDSFLFYATDAQGVTVHLLVDDTVGKHLLGCVP